MNNRDELEAALRANAAMEVPAPDPGFVDALERRLRAGGPGNVVPLARRARRFGATTLVVTLVLTGAAAAAGLVLTDPFGGDEDVPGAGATSSAASTTEVASTEPTTTDQGADTTLAAATTTTAATAVTSATTTTEVHVPATITVECHATGTSTQCTWGPLPAGTTKLLVLRGQYSPSGQGRVFTADIGAGVWTDPMPTPGVTYSFVLHAFDASDTDLGHSNLVMVDCC